jgi:hypothetical protein
VVAGLLSGSAAIDFGNLMMTEQVEAIWQYSFWYTLVLSVLFSSSAANGDALDCSPFENLSGFNLKVEEVILMNPY